MPIVRFVSVAAITLATGLWFGGTALAGGAYGSAISVVDSDPALIVSVKGSRHNRHSFRGSRYNRHSFRGSRYNRHSFKRSRRHHRSHRRHGKNFSFGYGYGYSPHYSYRPYSYYPYSYYPYYNYRRY